MKRSFSESDSDEGDLFERNERDSDGAENDSPETSARKRRRGIEKKRRDRINSSLAELRQLVPAAIRKQGSTKLEKAEILQLTVEHLRGLKYGAGYSRGFAMTRAFDNRIKEHQECIAEGKPCLSASADRSETARLSPARPQIINHLNWNNSTQSAPRSGDPSPPLTPSTKSDPEISSSWQSSAAFLSCVKQNVSEGCEGGKTQAHKRHDWGLSVALNYPSMFPLQTPGLSNVFHSPFGQAVPLIDWSMALITKTNISTPFRAPWAP
ncbi:uncharacterized protein LOC144659830 isoform X2 [Oculina patagonica]